MKRRVVVTGLGVLTSNAEGVSAFSAALREGASGIGQITQFDTGPFPCKIAGEIKHLPFEEEPADHLDRASRLAIRGAELALEDAHISPASLSVGELGVVVGTTCGGVLSLEKVSELLETGEVDRIPDWRVEEMSFYAATQHVARVARATGPVVTVAVACSSGSHAVGMAADLIRADKAPLVLAGGVDVISRFIYRGFAALNGLGAPPYKAFDKNRNGVVLGEGAGFLVLEDLEHARRRGAHIYAEVLGHSFNNDGCHIVNPNPTGEGIARSFKMALEDAGLKPEQIDHLNAHGTGTMANDSAETAGVKLAFGDVAQRIPVASIKPMIGHTSGAAGSIELIAAILSMRDGYVPATINFESVDPACDLNIAGNRREAKLDHVVSANSGFGGSNAAVVLGAYGADGEPADLSDKTERVVVTGIGLLHPDADTPDTLWARLHGGPARYEDGKPGLEVAPFDFFARSQVPMSKDSRRMDLFSQYSALAGLAALRDAGIDGEALGTRLGLVLGSANACLESNEKFSSGLTKAKVNPVIYQNTVSNASSGYLCMLAGIRGPVSVLNQNWISGASALAYGFDLVRSGRCQAVLAGGAERLCRMAHLSLERAGLLSAEHLSRPLDQSADGLVPSDGAAFLVLESLASAKARGAHIYAELTGYGFRSTAGQSAEDAVHQASREALSTLRSPRRVHVYASANGVSRLEDAERQGLARTFAEAEGRMHATLSTVKGALGDTLGAAGPLSAVVGAISLKRGELVASSVHPRPGARGPEVLTSPDAQGADALLISSADADGSCVTLAMSAMVDG